MTEPPPSGTPVCALAELAPGRGREFRFGAFRLLALRQGDAVHGYVNACPHFSIPLNYRPDEFHVYGDEVMCAHHSAMFRIADGVCIDGPCRGAALTAVPLAVEHGVIVLA